MVPRGEGRGLGERAGVGHHILGDRQAAWREGRKSREGSKKALFDVWGKRLNYSIFLPIKNQERRKG